MLLTGPLYLPGLGGLPPALVSLAAGGLLGVLGLLFARDSA